MKSFFRKVFSFVLLLGISGEFLPITRALDPIIGSFEGLVQGPVLERVVVAKTDPVLDPVLDLQIIGGNVSSSKLCVSLQSYANKKYIHFCGGSLIDLNLTHSAVLTAAHCVVYGPPNRVVLNSTDLSRPVFVSRNFILRIHPNYSRSRNLNDVAILELRESIPASIPRVRLPGSKTRVSRTPKKNALVTVLGWGRTSVETYETSRLLREVVVPVVPQKKCIASYGKIPISQFCAGFEKGGKDSCQGDSGGPLLVGNMLFGIVSYGKGCAQPKYYGVYQRTRSFLDFFSAT